jgi:hypothetical protein
VAVTFHWQRNKYAGQVPLLYIHIIRVLITTLLQEYTVQAGSAPSEHVLNIPFYTQYERNGFVYGAHPNYRGAGAEYNWAHVQWENGTDAVTGTMLYKKYKARIHGFILHPKGGTYAIIYSHVENIPKPICDARCIWK